MFDIWESSSHDDEVVTLVWLIVVEIIFVLNFPSANLLYGVVIRMVTFRVLLYLIIKFGTLEVVMHIENQYIYVKFYSRWYWGQNTDT